MLCRSRPYNLPSTIVSDSAYTVYVFLQFRYSCAKLGRCAFAHGRQICMNLDQKHRVIEPMAEFMQYEFMVPALIRGQVWPRGWSPLLLRGGAQEDLAFWVGILYTCPGKGLFALRSHCSRRGAAIQPQRFKQARATDAGAASF